MNLPEVGWIVKSQLATHDPSQLLAETIKVSQQLLTEGLVQIGDLTGEGVCFRSWDSDIDATITKIIGLWWDQKKRSSEKFQTSVRERNLVI